MKRLISRLLATLTFLAIATSASAQHINPTTQINWPLATGFSTPTLPCSTLNYGQPYTNLTTNVQSVCTASGWVPIGGGSGGGTVTNFSAPATANVVGSVTINTGGVYTACPTGITFTGGGGTGAAGTPQCSSAGGGNVQVSTVLMTNLGSGYTSAPAVNFTGGAGSGATGTAVLATWPTWLNAVVTNPTTTPSLYIFSGAFTANEVLATPDASLGQLNVRRLVSGDLPPATSSLIGAVKPGSGCSVDISGVLTCTGSGGGMVWPTGSAGSIPCYSGASTWCASYNASSPISYTFLPLATNTLPGIMKPDGSSCTVTSGVLTCSGGTASPLTTKGDLYGFSTTNARVPVGPDGDVLTADSTQALGIKWGSPATSGINQLTGDATAGPGTGSQPITFATVNTSPGACGDATHVCVPTTNGKGLVTSQTTAPILLPATTSLFVTAATCNNAVAFTTSFSVYDNNAPTTLCYNTAASSDAALSFYVVPTATQYAEAKLTIPAFWTGTSVTLLFTSNITTGNFTWNVQTACPALSGSTPGTPTWGTAVTSTVTVPGTSGQQASVTLNGIAANAVNGCPATGTTTPSELDVRVFVTAGTATGSTSVANLSGAIFNTSRSQ